MGAWADALGSVAVAASGGLDSSLICAALSKDAKDFLDGLLERHGIIDRKEVEQALATDITSRGSIIYRLLDLAEAENWARSWT